MMEQVKGKWIIYKKNKAYVSALILDNNLEKIQIEPCVHHQIGSIYIGKIQKIVKNIQAAFVEIAADTICYLPLNELDSPKKEGDQILVQIIQEAAKTKQATVSTNLSLSGKYSVVSIGGKKLHFSKKLHSGIKSKLTQYFQDETIMDEQSNLIFMEQDFSVIVRTNAIELNSYEILKEEILDLTKQLANIIQVASHRTLYSVVYRVMEPYLKTIQDSYGSEYGEIITDDMEIYDSIRDFLSSNETDSIKLSYYKDTQLSLNSLYSLDTKLREISQKKVWMKSGAYLLIEPTETLTVIDVNTGKYVGKGTKEETFFKINMEACHEICRQIRLRNLSGIILIDFINMTDEEHEKELMHTLKVRLKNDPITTTVIDITALGLVELTRKRTTKSIYEQMEYLL